MDNLSVEEQHREDRNNELGKTVSDTQHISANLERNYVGDSFSGWRTWNKGIEDEDGPLDHTHRTAVPMAVSSSESMQDKDLGLVDKEAHESQRDDGIHERNFLGDSLTFTSYFRSDLAPKSWELESAQPLMSSGQSRTHTLPRTRSLPEIRIPDDYDSVLDEKRETSSLQDNVITFVSADEINNGSLKGGCLDGKVLHHQIGLGPSQTFIGNFNENSNDSKESYQVKMTMGNGPSANCDISYAMTIHEGNLVHSSSKLDGEPTLVKRTRQPSCEKRKLYDDTGKKPTKARRKYTKPRNIESLMPDISPSFVGGTTMILDQPISQIGGLYTMQISSANPGMQTVIQPQPIDTMQQPIMFDSINSADINLEKCSSENFDSVNQQWFIAKDEKSSMSLKGTKWKQGMWSKDEVEVLKTNIDNYCKLQGIEDPCQLIFSTPKDERKQFYKSIAKGISRPLFAIYRKTLRLYDSKNYIGKYTEEEVTKLEELHAKYGNDWATIGNCMGRSAASVKDRCRLLWKNKKVGRWTEEEEVILSECVREQTNTKEGEPVTTGIVWSTIAEKLGNRTEKQCRSKWLNYLNWKEIGGKEWTKNDEIELIERISRLNINDEIDLNWKKLAEQWPSARSPQWLRGKWWALKKRVPDFKSVGFRGVIDYLQTKYVDALKMKIDRQTVALASTFSNSVSLHNTDRFANHMTLSGLTASSTPSDIGDADSLSNTQSSSLINTSTIDLASLQGYQLQLQLSSLSPHQLLIPVSSGGLPSNLSDHFIIPVNMTSAMISSSTDQTGFIVQNVTEEAGSNGVADVHRDVELTQTLVQTDLSIPIPTGEITQETLAAANIEAISAGMVVTLEGSSLDGSAVVDVDGTQQSFSATFADHGAVKVVKVDPIENHDLGSPL